MIQKNPLPQPIIILSKKDCKQCENQYNFFKEKYQFTLKIEFKDLNLEFKQLITSFLKQNFQLDEITYPIILLPNFEKQNGEYLVIVGFTESMFVVSYN